MAIVDSGTGRTPAGTARTTGRAYQGGAFQGSPTTPVPTTMPTRMNGTMQAFGLTPEQVEERRKQTGVDAGGGGYVSGQVAPTGQAMAALGAGGAPPGGTSFDPGAIVNKTGNSMATNVEPNGGVRGGGQAPGGTTTTTGALTTGGPPPPAGSRASNYPPPGDTSTRTGALTGGGAGGMGGNTGTTTGPSPVPTGGSASPTVNVLNRVSPGLGDSVDPGSNLLKPTMVDLGPALASQRVGFGAADDFSTERYNYRPGEAASQDRVQMDRAAAEEVRARQLQTLQDIERAARGEVPSAAELQMRREAGRNVAATLGQARALGGRSAGGAARAGTLASADILSRGNMDAAQLRAQEQDTNRQRAISAALGIRGQDETAAEGAARLEQEANANNLRAQLEQNQLAEQHRQALIDAQLKALGIGTSSSNAIVAGGKANADADNKLKGNLLEMGGSVFGM